VPPNKEEREPDANQVMQQATEPRMKAVDNEKLALQVAQQPSAFIGLQITPPQPPFLTQKDLETPIPKSLQKQPRAHVLSTAYHKIVPCFLVLFQPERVVPLGTNLWLAVLRKKRTLLLFLIALLATLLVMGVGAGLWFYTATSYHSSSAIPTLTNHPKATPPYTTANPRSKVTATPTPIGTSFPQVTKLYSGTIHDIAGNVTTKLSFTDMQQQQGSISGYFIGLGLKGPLKGTINTSRHIQFVVMGNAEQPNLSFDGVMLSDGNIAGIYCGLNQEGKCSDYGIWSVTPVAS